MPAPTRYQAICVAPLPGFGPSNLGDDYDAAVVAWADGQSPAHFDIYDRLNGEYVTPCCQEEEDEARARHTAPTDPEDQTESTDAS